MLQRATLISRNLKDGRDFIYDDVPLGKVYYVDLKTVTDCTFVRSEGDFKPATLPCVLAYDTPDGGYRAYLPLELLKVEANA